MRKVMIAIGLLMLLTACIPLTTRDGRQAKLGTESGERTLTAVVKGSVYETGEAVSVFGTCLDQYQQPIPGVYAQMSSWYPNGTQFFSGVNMTEIQSGYFLYQGTMSAVRGTYLTEMRCKIDGSAEEARAFGEWQNPYWVARISNISQQASDLSVQIGDLRINMSDSFLITWSMIQNLNATVQLENLTNQIAYVAMVANASVDRNDSYLAQLLLQLLNQTGMAPVAIANVTLESTPTTFWDTWEVFAIPVDADGVVLSPSDGVNCYMTNNNIPAANASMMSFYNGLTGFTDSTSNNDDIIESGVLEQGFFYKAEQVRLPPSEPFNWNVTCSTT